MSDPQRYTLALPEISYGMDESNKGEYVLWRDYARLKAENERLRKAGDAMVEIVKGTYCIDKPSVLIAWNAAKEGKPSV